MPDFVWKQGDDGPPLLDRLSYAGGQPIPEAGLTLTFRLRSLASASLTTLTGTAEFTDADGSCRFTPTTADTENAVGNYIGEWVLTNELGQQQTFPTEGFLWGRIEPSAVTAPQLIVGLDDVKEHLNIDPQNRTRDSKLMGYIQAVTPLIEAQVGPIVPRVYEEWFDGGSDIRDVLRQPSAGFGTDPIFKVVAASEYRGPIEYPLALVASPAFGSIYSIFVNTNLGTITRRTAGGRTLPFMPGRESIHLFYETGLSRTPDNVAFAAKECVRTINDWTRQVGRGSEAQADYQEVGPGLTLELSRMIRTMLMPTKRFPSFA